MSDSIVASPEAYVSCLYPFTCNPPLVLDDGSVIASGHVVVDAWGPQAHFRTLVVGLAFTQVNDLFAALEEGQGFVEHVWSPHPSNPRVQPLSQAPVRIQREFWRVVPDYVWDVVAGGGILIENGKPVAV